MLVLSVLFGLSSCMDTKYVTKKTTLDKTVDSVKALMGYEGYYPTGFFTKSTNEMEVVGVSYTSKTGFGTAMKNNYVTQDTYTFADSLGNSASYSMFYALDRRENVVKAGLCGCETSNPQDYDKVCGSISQMDWMPNSDSIKFVNPVSIIAIVAGSAVVVLILSHVIK